MNVHIYRLRPLIAELKLIRQELERMNKAKELELAYQGLHVRPPVADTTGDDPVVSYTNEEADAVGELQEHLGQVSKAMRLQREEDEAAERDQL